MAIQFLSMREEWPKQGNVQESPSGTFINETQREKKRNKTTKLKKTENFVKNTRKSLITIGI